MNEYLQKSILELQLRRSKLMDELNEVNLQIQFLREQINDDDKQTRRGTRRGT